MTLGGSETRWMMPSAPTPSIAIPFATGWSDTTSFGTRILTASRETGLYPTPNGYFTFQTSTGGSTVTNYSLAMVQFQTQPIVRPAYIGPSSVFNLATYIYESSGTGTARLAFAFYVYRANGTKVQLLSGGADTVGNTATVVASTAPTLVCTSAVPAGPLTLGVGDIIVCEVGFFINQTSATTYVMYFGRGSKTFDAPLNAGSTTVSGDPWFGITGADLYANNQLTARTVRTRPRLFAPGITR